MKMVGYCRGMRKSRADGKGTFSDSSTGKRAKTLKVRVVKGARWVSTLAGVNRSAGTRLKRP